MSGKVTLISSDGVRFEVDEVVAKKSQLLKNMIEGIFPFIQTPAQNKKYFYQMSRTIHSKESSDTVNTTEPQNPRK